MITTSNEFETIPCWTHIAGDSLGTVTTRQTTAELIKILNTVTSQDTYEYWRDLAETSDENEPFMWEMQQDIADLINDNAPLPEYCSITLEDNEWRVRPNGESAEEELEKFDECPEDWQADFLLVVSDHGNATCCQWHPTKNEYQEIWSLT